MKFQNSKFESRYNDLWNLGAVRADQGMRTINGGKVILQQADYWKLLTQYSDTVNTMIDNLKRQLPLFSDQEYVNDYLVSTCKIAKEDFEGYRLSMVKLYGADSDCVLLIDKTLETVAQFLPQDTSILNSSFKI